MTGRKKKQTISRRIFSLFLHLIIIIPFSLFSFHFFLLLVKKKFVVSVSVLLCFLWRKIENQLPEKYFIFSKENLISQQVFLDSDSDWWLLVKYSKSAKRRKGAFPFRIWPMAILISHQHFGMVRLSKGPPPQSPSRTSSPSLQACYILTQWKADDVDNPSWWQ